MRSPTTRRFVLLAVVLSAGIGLLFARTILTIRSDEWTHAQQTNANLSHTLEQNIARTLDGFDHSLAGVVNGLGRTDLQGLTPEQRNAVLFDHSLRTRGLGSIIVLDTHGDIVLESGSPSGPPRKGNFADRDYFRVHQKDSYQGLYIGAPVHSRLSDSILSLPLSRPYFHPDGSLAGVVVGSIRLEYFRELFGAVDLGPLSGIGLWRLDGTTIARFPYVESEVGSPLQDTDLLRRLTMASMGSFTARDALNGGDHLHTFQHIGTYPLVVDVSQSVDTVLAKWRRSAWTLGGFALLLMAACLGLTALFLREIHKRQRISAQLRQAEHDLRTILDNLPTLIGYWDKDLTNRFANQAYLDWMGISAPAIRKMSLPDLLGERAYAQSRPHIEKALEGYKQTFERTIHLPNGEERHTLVCYIPDFDGNDVRGVFVQISDLTDRKRMEDLLFEEKELVRLTLQSIGDAVLCTDAQGHVTYINPVAEDLTGWQAFDAAGRDGDDVAPLQLPASEPATASPLRMALQHGTAQTSMRGALLQRRDGRQVDVELSASPIADRNGTVTGAVMILRDVTESMAIAKRMAHLAQYDPLTDLPNRVLLQDRAQQAIAHAQRNGGSLALMYMDLDGFKQVNDTLGHDAGDLLLVQVAQRLTGAVRQSDTVCRQGGDEFVVLLPALQPPEQACRVAHKIIAACVPEFTIGEHTLRIQLSGGIALYPQHGTTFEALARSADAAMYAAKRAGRGHFRLYAGPDNEPTPMPPLLSDASE